jgi:Ser/Thr protein kinase RdoA (MazF antagonist)
MRDVESALSHWFAPDAAQAPPVAESGGFSGAGVWRVLHAGRRYALRRWPPGVVDEARLAALHRFAKHLAESNLPTPAPMTHRDGGTWLAHAKSYWQLEPWMPGDADYWRNPRPAKLAAALETLAHIHLAAAALEGGAPWRGASASMERRVDRLRDLSGTELPRLRAVVDQLPDSEESRQAQTALRLIVEAAPAEREKALRWQRRVMRLQWRLGDVWHDHVLFTSDRVTGVIDFGAASIDAPAGDVARLLGSLAGDDRTAWQLGLNAYHAVRPLDAEERAAVGLFDSSGVLLSAVNWLHWLYVEPPPVVTANRSRALERLGKLTARLRLCSSD